MHVPTPPTEQQIHMVMAAHGMLPITVTSTASLVIGTRVVSLLQHIAAPVEEEPQPQEHPMAVQQVALQTTEL